MDCLEENDVVELLASNEGSAVTAREHVAQCERCRVLVASVARVLHPAQGPESEGWLDDADLLQPGDRLGDYEIVKLVGQGGMGIVYAARDARLDRRVAVKILRLGASTIDRLRSEASIIASLSHPNVVEVYDVGDSEYGAFVAMEFVEGEDLSRWLASPRTRAQKLDVLRQAGEGLAAAHDAGIVHRDFKPQNVLIGADGRARVVDFGLAVSTQTRKGETGRLLAGTPAYLAPEQIRGESIDAAADQFSFCLVAFEALGGKAPFAGRDLAQRLAAIEDGRVRSTPGLPGRVRAVIVRGLAADPAARFSTMPELLHELREAPSGRWPLAALALVLIGAATWFALPRETPPSPLPEASVELEKSALEERFDRLYAQVLASQQDGTWERSGRGLKANAVSLRDAAQGNGDHRVQGKAGMLLGTIAIWELQHDDARHSLESAFIAAQRAKDHKVAFESARLLMQLAVAVHGDEAMLERWSKAARTAATAADDPVIWARLLIFEGRIASARGEPAGAIEKYDEAEGFLDEQTPVLTWEELLSGRGMAKLQMGHPDAGLEDFERSLARLDGVYDRDAMDFASTLNGLGVAQRALGRFDDAARTFERLKEIIPPKPGNPDLAAVRGNLAQIYADMGRYEEALVEFRAVRSAFEAFAGPEHPDAARTSAAIASALYQLGRYEDAKREAEEALRWEVPATERVQVQLIWASCQAKLGNAAEARPALEAILTDKEATDTNKTEARALLRGLPSGR